MQLFGTSTLATNGYVRLILRGVIPLYILAVLGHSSASKSYSTSCLVVGWADWVGHTVAASSSPLLSTNTNTEKYKHIQIQTQRNTNTYKCKHREIQTHTNTNTVKYKHREIEMQ